jgi:hypothetical protein
MLAKAAEGTFGGIMVRINFNRLRFLVIDANAHM